HRADAGPRASGRTGGTLGELLQPQGRQADAPAVPAILVAHRGRVRSPRPAGGRDRGDAARAGARALRRDRIARLWLAIFLRGCRRSRSVALLRGDVVEAPGIERYGQPRVRRRIVGSRRAEPALGLDDDLEDT